MRTQMNKLDEEKQSAKKVDELLRELFKTFFLIIRKTYKLDEEKQSANNVDEFTKRTF